MNTSEDIDNSRQESVEKKHSPALNTFVTQQNVNKNVTIHSISTVESEINQIDVFDERDVNKNNLVEIIKVSNIITVKTNSTDHITKSTIDNEVQQELTGERQISR